MARQIQYDFDITGNGLQTLGQMEENLEMLNSEIKNVDRNSEAFVELSGKIQQATKQLEGANREIEGFTDERRVKALQGGIDIFTGLLETTSGIATQLGLSNEEFEETITNLVAVSQTASGIRTAAQGFVDLRESIRGTTVAQNIFNAATYANPYVAAAAVIVIAIGSIVTQFDEFKRALGDISIGLPDLGDIFSTFKGVISGVAAVVANTLGSLAAGIIHLFSGRWSDALDSFGNVFSEAGGAYERGFDEGVTQDDPETVEETVAEQAAPIGRGVVRGVNEGIESAELNPLAAQVLPVGDPEIVDKLRRKNLQDRREEYKADQAEINSKKERNEQILDGIGLTAQFAQQAAELAPRNKALAKAAIVANAAVAGIGIWRDYHGEKNTIPAPFNTIAAGVAIGALGIATHQALSSLSSDTPAADTGGFSAGPTVSTPSINDVDTGALNDSGTALDVNTQANNQNNTVVAVVEQGSVSNATERQQRLNQRRSFTGR